MATETRQRIRLSVSRSLPKDVGRGLARLDPTAMKELGVQPGDVISILGRRETAAKAVPTHPEDRGKGVLQIDAVVRHNAGAAPGDEVRVERADASVGRAVVLSSAGPRPAGAAFADTRYLARALEGVPLRQGDRTAPALLGGRRQEFTVLRTEPAGVIVPGTDTRVTVKESGASPGAGATYEDVGGLGRELQRIREMIELPLKRPELFERLGIEPPKGVLLHGPPGCGKTLIARAVASETDASFFHVSGPEVIHKFYGESEAHLRAIFTEAREKAPSIVFIDEIDAIAAKRDEVRGDQQVEKRVVAQLLALMDGLRSRGQVVVIGATNMPNALDPAIRRPGRFDREIAISAPDYVGRLETLQVHTRGMPLAADVGLERLAEHTHGFVGADLESLCREAAMATLRRVAPRLTLDAEALPDEVLRTLEVSAEDFAEALRQVEPSAIREVFTEVPNVSWDRVGGLHEAKRVLVEAVEWPLRFPHLFRHTGAAPARGVLLAGPPGTGKTLLAKAVATESGVNFIAVKGPELLSRWVGESEKGVREVFRKARQASPCIVFLDEVDALAPARGQQGHSNAQEGVISQLLTELDGIEELRGVLVLAATNRPDILDPALLRAGRFEVHVTLPMPDLAARREILGVHAMGRPLTSDVDLDSLATATDGMTGADIEAIFRAAALSSIREHVEGGGALEPSEGEDPRVHQRHLERAVREADARRR